MMIFDRSNNRFSGSNFFAFSILFIPIVLLLGWHLQNHRLPNDDAANYAATAYEIFDRFQSRGTSEGLLALFEVRGWRPIFFPNLLVPYLLLFRGNIPLAVGAVLWMLYGLLTLYSYKFCRLFLPPCTACVAVAVVITSPFLLQFATILFSELSWVCFAVACAYHLLRSNQFQSVRHSSLAGVFLALMTITRPAESIVIAAIPMSLFLYDAIRRFAIRWSDLALAFPLILACTGLLMASVYVEAISKLLIWVAAGGVGVICLAVALRKREYFSVAHYLFWLLFCGINIFWWAGFARQLYDWMHVTSFGQMAKVTEPASHQYISTILYEILNYYGAFQLCWLFAIALAIFVTRMRWSRSMSTVTSKPNGATIVKLNSSAGRNNDNTAFIRYLTITVVGTIFPILVLYWLSGTGDLRRVIVGMVFLLLALSIAGLRKLEHVTWPRVALIAVIPFLQTINLALVTVGQASFGKILGTCCGVSLEAPFGAHDGNMLMADTLTRKLPKDARVAVYTLALFSAVDRVYEPAGLQLALLARKSKITVGYLWDESAYEIVIGKLARSGYQFLLLDIWNEGTIQQTHMPYVRFTKNLLVRLWQGELAGLRLVDSVMLAGRRQLLFQITARGLISNSSPDLDMSWFEGNIAAARNGARAVTTNHQIGFDGASLNDDSPLAWGSAEGREDVFAAIELPKPETVQSIRLVLFSPGGRAHLRDLSVVTADAEYSQKSDWRIVRSRIQGQSAFAEKITIPELPDATAVIIEIDANDTNSRSHRVWGVACLRASRGYASNYIQVGTGVYIRELQMKAVPVRE